MVGGYCKATLARGCSPLRHRRRLVHRVCNAQLQVINYRQYRVGTVTTDYASNEAFGMFNASL
jgi:hypothetical protein